MKLNPVKNPFHLGETKRYTTTVTASKLAEFEAGVVHPVYSTFALGRDVEWACRLFVLEMKEEGEEGIGAYLSIEHVAPAPLGSSIEILATLEEVKKNEVHCAYEVYSGSRLVAKGQQIQKIIQKVRFDALLASIKN
jgi:fluoroacetyl-CoA thioesterase